MAEMICEALRDLGLVVGGALLVFFFVIENLDFFSDEDGSWDDAIWESSEDREI